MSVHYIVDEEGKQTGVLVSIDEWKQIQEQLSGELAEGEIPEWQLNIARERLAEYMANPENLVDSDDVFVEHDQSA